MKAVLDVHYRSGGATAACVVFVHWGDASPRDIVRAEIPAPRPYRAGPTVFNGIPQYCRLASPLSFTTAAGPAMIFPAVSGIQPRRLPAGLDHEKDEANQIESLEGIDIALSSASLIEYKRFQNLRLRSSAGRSFMKKRSIYDDMDTRARGRGPARLSEECEPHLCFLYPARNAAKAANAAIGCWMGF